jgi:hypothetical protein
MPIQTITAYLNHPQAPTGYEDCYCFDNEAMGLVAEPFVPSATAAIQVACSCLKSTASGPPPAVTLRFCADDPDALQSDPASTSSVWIELSLIGPQDNGHTYCMDVLDPEGAQFNYAHSYSPQELWLCPVLLSYFPQGAPKLIFVQITPQG